MMSSYYICKYCREVFADVCLLKSHKKTKHPDRRTREVVTLNHFSQEHELIKVKNEQAHLNDSKHNDGSSSDAMTFYECPECPADIADPLKFFIHLESHSLKPEEPKSPQLFHTSDGRILTIDELPSKLQIFIPRIKLTSWTESCAQFSCLVPTDSAPVDSDPNKSEVTATPTTLKMKLRSRRPGFVKEIETEDDLSEGSNDDSGDDDGDDPIFDHDAHNQPSKVYCKQQFQQGKRINNDSKGQPHFGGSHPSVKARKGRQTKPFHCKICNVGFMKLDYMVRHFTKHIENNPYKCTVCGQNTDSKHQLRTHMLRHTGYEKVRCEFCNKTFTRMKGLRHHIQTIHATSIVTPQQEVHVCSICGRGFKTKMLADAHLAMHKRTEEANKTKPFQCTTCGAGFVSDNHLLRHAVMHNEKNPFKCKLCGYNKATTGYHLKRHMGRHVDSVKVPCKVCGKLLVDENLRRHMKISHPEEFQLQQKRKGKKHRKGQKSSSSTPTAKPSGCCTPTLVDVNGKVKLDLVELPEAVRKVSEATIPTWDGRRKNPEHSGEHWRVATAKKIMQMHPSMETRMKNNVQKGSGFYRMKNRSNKCNFCDPPHGLFTTMHSLRKHIQRFHANRLGAGEMAG